MTSGANGRVPGRCYRGAPRSSMFEASPRAPTLSSLCRAHWPSRDWRYGTAWASGPRDQRRQALSGAHWRVWRPPGERRRVKGVYWHSSTHSSCRQRIEACRDVSAAKSTSFLSALVRVCICDSYCRQPTCELINISRGRDRRGVMAAAELGPVPESNPQVGPCTASSRAKGLAVGRGRSLSISKLLLHHGASRVVPGCPARCHAP